MSPDATSRYLQKLPVFITFFFSSMLVRTTGTLADLLKFTTGPEFQNVGGDAWLVVYCFTTTLFFVVFSWLAYNFLIERFPYTEHISLFFLDVGRFMILYVIMNFAFLAGHPRSYVYYIISLGVFHTGAMGWHVLRLRLAHSTERPEHVGDVRFLAAMSAVYYSLAAIYAVLVGLRWSSSPSWGLHTFFVFLTSAVLIFVSVNRLKAMRTRMVQGARASA